MAMDCGQVQRDPNHLRIDRAMDSVGRSIEQLERLLNEVRNGADGPQPAMPTSAPKLNPSLAVVLSDSSDRINSYAKQISSLVDELRTLLF